MSILPENETHFFIWLGASDFAEEGIWQWVTGEAFSFTDWHEGEPNGGERENVLLLTNYYQSRWGWNDADGMVPGYQGFVCEWDE